MPRLYREGILFRLLAFLFVETRRATSPSPAFLLAETQECVGNDRLCAQAEIRQTHIIYMRVRWKSCRDAVT